MLLPLGTKAFLQSNRVLCTPFSGTHLPSPLGNFSPLGLLVLGLLIPIGEIRPMIEDAQQRYNISLPCNLNPWSYVLSPKVIVIQPSVSVLSQYSLVLCPLS